MSHSTLPRKRPATQLAKFWIGTLAFGNTLGALGSLVSFPSAIAAVFYFHSELWDLVTTPDVTAKLREITLRCVYKFEDDELHDQYLARKDGAFAAICRNAPLGVSFSYELHNKDSIERPLRQLRVVVDIPAMGTHDLAFAYDVEHVIRDGYDEAVRQPWFVKNLPSNVPSTYEALTLVEPAEGTVEEIHFGSFIEKLNAHSDAFADIPSRFQLLGKVGEWDIKLASCTWRFTNDRIQKFLSSKPDDQFQLTGYCDTS